jgi:DNA polymerase-3 subunit delta'
VKLKLPANARNWRIILIENAHNLTNESQNALLKLLEEPPQQTIFLLTAQSLEKILPTIRSRTQQLTLTLPSQPAIKAFFQSRGHEETVVQQASMMSGGLPGLTAAILENDEHPLKDALQTAKMLLKSTQFERLCYVDSLAKDKPKTLQLLFVLQHMARAATAQGARASDGSATKRIKQWHRVQKAAYEAEQAYAVSAQAKLTLTNLMLSL